MRYSTLPLFLIFGFVFLCIGCNSNVAVKGKVVFPDGKPLEIGMVCFQGDKFVSRGLVQPDGQFTMATLKPGDGVAPGSYKVFIANAIVGEPVKDAKYDPDGPPPEGKEKPLIARKFMDPNTSGIVCEVSKGMKLPFDIQVEYPK